jgi:hypothetical protein
VAITARPSHRRRRERRAGADDGAATAIASVTPPARAERAHGSTTTVAIALRATSVGLRSLASSAGGSVKVPAVVARTP